MKDLHVDVLSAQVSKKRKKPCGDYFCVEKTEQYSTIILADGIGSGVRANISAVFCATRLSSLLKQGYSLRHAFAEVVKSMHQVRGTDQPYAVFSVARISSGGETTVLSYEMPPPIYIGKNKHASVLQQRIKTLGREVIGEANCFLEAQEAIVLMSDGITQAGIGTELLRKGWGSDGVCSFVNTRLKKSGNVENLASEIMDESYLLSEKEFLDDATILCAQVRNGNTMTILTGPPESKDMDEDVVKRFLGFPGYKVVCGGTTADITARAIGTKVRVEEHPKSLIAPPCYFIDGIHLVTEGAVTLNQAYRILDADPNAYELDSGVTQLCYFFSLADKIRFIVGKAKNIASSDISFQQRGILPRNTIIPLLADKLRAQGKLVVVEFI